jgi:signal transduction histidine kinase
MITAFVVIYVITYTKIQIENKNKLSTAPILHQNGFENAPPTNQDVQVNKKTAPSDYSLSFVIKVGNKGQILDIESFVHLPERIYREAAKMAWKNKNNQSTVTIDGKVWEYSVNPETVQNIKHENGQVISQNIKLETYQIIFVDVTDSYNTLNQLLTTFLIVGVTMLVIIYFISLYFANRAIRPIKESWEKQKQFVADASHELKTPLTIIRANADALLTNQEDPIKKQRKWLDYIQQEITRMEKLVNDLLVLAKTENLSIRTCNVPFNISEVVNHVILSMEAIIFEKGFHLTHTIQNDIMVKGDAEQIKQVVLILLDNAIKYTNRNGTIDLSLKKAHGQVLFSITNSGRGISKEDLPKVFDRFYRTDPSRTKGSGGYGLGLSVAKSIIHRHGGKIYAQSVENQFTTFVFSLRLK